MTRRQTYIKMYGPTFLYLYDRAYMHYRLLVRAMRVAREVL